MMSLYLKRSFGIALRLKDRIKPAFDSDNIKSPKSVYENIENNLPSKKKSKAWERAGEDKDEFFKKRYSHIHAKQKENDQDKRRKTYQDVRDLKKKKSFDDTKSNRFDHKRKFQSRDIYRTLQPNPLSEFIYGSSPVLAALKANKREFFNKLIIYKPENKDKEIIKLASKLGVKVIMADSKQELNRLTNNAVHNGYILETKPLVPTSVHQLGVVQGQDYTIDEDNLGDVLPQPYVTKNPNPLGIYLDGVTDPHNVGSIIRSAYFLGADFLVISERNSAPLSPTVTKVSVGATEFLPIMAAAKPLTFFERSKENGWTFIAASSNEHRDIKIVQTLQSKQIEISDLNALLEKGPCVLVLGSEGEGIRTTLRLRSDFLVSINGGTDVDPAIDSLNVGVAGALLIQKTLQP